MALNFNIVKSILNGRFDDIPDFRKREVRIFLSSTFTDTHQERDYLIEKIFPRLKDHLRRKYDLDFQPVDMRWGISSDAFEYHGTTDLCLKEIANCQKVSIGPSFVTLIGQKYGLRPMPTVISVRDYEIIINELENGLNEDLSISYESPLETYKIDNILRQCYKLDTNSMPSVYRILPISQIITSYSSQDPQIKKDSIAFWDKTKVKLLYLLRAGAESAFKKNLFDIPTCDKYFISITEKEIHKGILNERIKHPDAHALCFMREIVNLEENLHDTNIPRFIDIKISDKGGKVEIDEEAQIFLRDLKQNKLSVKLNTMTNIFKFKVRWKNNQIDEDDLKTYLYEFGETFFTQIIRLVDEAVRKENFKESIANQTYKKMGLINNKAGTTNSKIENDMLKEFKSLFQELSLQIDQYNQEIEKYLLNDSTLPFVVTGESGCGKTTLMAILHQKIPSMVENPSRYIIITKFLGTTAETSTIFKAYKTIALQLHYLINLLKGENDKQNYEQYTQCTSDLEMLTEYIIFNLNLIYTLDPNKKIVIIIDSLDQLLSNDFKNVDQWIITNLPANTKYIVSTIPDHGNLLNIITKMIRKKYDDKHKLTHNQLIDTNSKITQQEYDKKINDLFQLQILHVNQLTPTESETILSKWLLEAKLNLSDDQWSELRYIFKNGKLSPLFLKLLFDIVSNWRSYDKADPDLLKCLKVDEIIIYRFHNLERLHGKALFRRAICYMTLCKNGINDGELEDILSLDEDVLFSVFEFSMPPIRRIPTILWIRIKKDLARYIVEKEANDVKVNYWHHRRFIDVTLKYIKSKSESLISNSSSLLDENDIICRNILDYFNEKWKDKPKPYELNEYLKKKYNKTSSEADRFVSSQPIEYLSEVGLVKYNKRKLCELPNCLINMNDSLFAMENCCELVFFNYEFLRAKFICEDVADIMSELSVIINNPEKWDNNDQTHSLFVQLKLFHKLMIICGQQIDENPNSLSYQITSRFLFFYGKQKYITNLIDQCDKHSSKHCAFISPCFQQQTPGGFLISNNVTHKDPIKKVLLLFPYIFTYSITKICIYLRTEKGIPESLFEIKLPNVKKVNQFLAQQMVYQHSLSKSDIFQENNRSNAFKEVTVIHNHKHDDSVKKKSKKRHNQEKLKIKSIISSNEILESLSKSSTENNPNLFPISFLIICKHYTYITDANKQIKFAYKTLNSDPAGERNHRKILDVFVLEPKQLIIVEKNAKSLKIFNDYENNMKSYSEFKLGSDSRINQSITSNSPCINLEDCKVIDLVLLMENGEIRQYIIKANTYNSETPSYSFDSSDSMAGIGFRETDCMPLVFSSNEDMNSSDDDKKERNLSNLSDQSDLAKTNKRVFKKINDLSVCLVNIIMPTGFPNDRLFKLKDFFICLKKFGAISRLYFSTFDNSFMILSQSNSNKPSCCLFKDFTKQPIIKVRSSFHPVNREIFTGAVQTKDFLYIIHTSRKNDKNKSSLCKLELNEKVDFFLVLDNKYYILCRNGIIELYKLRCLSKTHRVKLVFSINTLSKNVTDLINIGGILYCSTNEGAFNTYNMIYGKNNEKIYPSFDRTFNALHKIYTSKCEAISISNLCEITVWDMYRSKIMHKIDVDTVQLGSNKVSKLKVNMNKNVMCLLMRSGCLGFYKSNEMIKLIDLHLDKSIKHNIVFLNDQILTKSSMSVEKGDDEKLTLNLLDLTNLDFYQVNLNDGFKMTHINVDTFKTFKNSMASNNIYFQDTIKIYVEQYDCVLILDAFLQTFTMLTYSKQSPQYSKQNERNSVRFMFSKDETHLRKFFNIYSQSKMKYKVLYSKDCEIYFSISAYVKVDIEADEDDQEEENIDSSIIVKACLLMSSLKMGHDDVELLIMKTYPFCSCYEFLNIDDTLILSFNYFIDVDFNLSIEKSIYFSSSDQNYINIVDLKTNALMFELDLKNLTTNSRTQSDSNVLDVEILTLSSNKEYLMFFDNKKQLWLYRTRDQSKLACLFIYGRAKQIKFSSDNRMACLSMNDRRIFTLLIVDPHIAEHDMRISEMPSRNLKTMQTVKSAVHQFKKKINIVELKANENETIEESNAINDHIDKMAYDHQKGDLVVDSSEYTSTEDEEGDNKKYRNEMLAKKEHEESQSKKKLIRQSTFENIGKPKHHIFNGDEEEIERSKDEKIVYLGKRIHYPINIKIGNKDLATPNWLKDYLEKRDVKNQNQKPNFDDNNKESDLLIHTNRTSNISSMDEFANLEDEFFTYDNNKTNDDIIKFNLELKTIIQTNLKEKKEISLSNAGRMAKVANNSNTSTRMCHIC